MSQVLHGLLSEMAGAERRYGPGQYVFHRDDAAAAIFQVIDGTVHLVRHQKDGATIVLHRGQAGSLLAEAALFSPAYHCDAVAATPARLKAISKRVMRARLRDDPAFADAWAGYLAHEVQRARFRSEMLSLRTVAARFDAWTLFNGAPPKRGEWKVVADELGVSPEALYRELARRR